jgi:capsular polysaccharide transport system permease protein
MTAFFVRNTRVLGALIMREMTTRFGREGLGFAWLVAEPLMFCFGVLILWTATKPAYEHGVRLAPFVMTGYMSLILMRHLLNHLGGALQANQGLLYHRQITPLHIFLGRIVLEIGGTTAAFVVVYVVLIAIRQVGLPHDYLLLYGGWLTLAWISSGFALILSGLAMRYDLIERIVGLISYALIPLSGAFSMASWVPEAYRDTYLLIPFVHGIEMIRAGVFGEFVPTYYDVSYAVLAGAVFNILGMVLVAGARDRLDAS